jgi:membrane protease YdiL (CAAX protease family)
VKYYLFLLLVLIFSIPFYVWGAISPVAGLPFGLPISFLMIFVPFFLSITYAWTETGPKGVLHLFVRIFDLQRAKTWAAVFSLVCMPAAVLLSYFTMVLFSFPVPEEIVIPVREIPLMLLLYFLGAIPEEFGWTMTLTEPLTKRHGPIGAGALIGLVWALWHVIPWSWAHNGSWVLGMIVMNLLMRIGMVYAFMKGGASLFYALVFHTMINVSMGVFPNSGSHTNPWIISIWLFAFLAITMFFLRQKQEGSVAQVENLGTKL